VQSPIGGFLTCDDPLIDVIGLGVGANRYQAPLAVNDESSTPLQYEGGRGAGIGGIAFDQVLFGTCYRQASTETCVDTLPTVTSFIYSAICKMPFDVEQYENSGNVFPAYVPNIIHGGTTVPGLIRQVLLDPHVDVIWRWLDVINTPPCCECHPIVSDGCPFAGVSGRGELVGLSLNSMGALGSGLADRNKVRSIRVKNRRFLKENEGLFLVRNIVSGLPSNSIFVLVSSYYGKAAVRVAR